MSYVSDWFISGSDLPADAIVAVAYKSRNIGLYKVKDLGDCCMTLSHGGISFPVGTQIIIDDFQNLVPKASRPFQARVTQNTPIGIQIAW
jgi:hypothetical protein